MEIDLYEELKRGQIVLNNIKFICQKCNVEYTLSRFDNKFKTIVQNVIKKKKVVRKVLDSQVISKEFKESEWKQLEVPRSVDSAQSDLKSMPWFSFQKKLKSNEEVLKELRQETTIFT